MEEQTSSTTHRGSRPVQIGSRRHRRQVREKEEAEDNQEETKSEASTVALGRGVAESLPMSAPDGGTGSAQHTGFIAISDILALHAIPVATESEFANVESELRHSQEQCRAAFFEKDELHTSCQQLRHELSNVESELRHSQEQCTAALSSKDELVTASQALQERLDASMVLQDKLTTAQNESSGLHHEVSQLQLEMSEFAASDHHGALSDECHKLRIELEVARRFQKVSEERAEMFARHSEERNAQKDVLHAEKLELVRYELTCAENDSHRLRHQLEQVKAAEHIAARQVGILTEHLEEMSFV